MKNEGVLYRRAVLDLNRIAREVAITCEDEKRGHYMRLKKTRILRALAEAAHHIRQCEPQTSCPHCDSDGCTKCHGTGFHIASGEQG